MRRVEVTVTLEDDGGRKTIRSWTLERHEAPHKEAAEFVESRLASEKDDLEKAPKPAKYKSKGMNQDI